MMKTIIQSALGVFLGVILASGALEDYHKYEEKKAMNAQLEHTIKKFYEQFID